MKIYFVRNSAPAIWRALIAVGILLTGGKFAALRAQSVTNYAADASSLRDAINLANTNPGPHVIILATNAVYSCSNVDNFWYGPNALPPIASDITIEGNGAVMVRSATSRLRFFYVGADSNTLASLNYNSPGAGKLTLRNLILTNGLALGGNGGGGGGGMGGAIFNQGILILYSVTFSGNTAQGGNGASNGGGAAAYYNGLGGGGMGEDGTEYRGGGFGGSVTPSGSHGASSGSGGGVGGGGGGFGVTDNATNSHGGGFSNGLGGGNLGGNGSGGGGGTSSSTNGGAGGGFGGGGFVGLGYYTTRGGGGGGGGVGGGGGGGVSDSSTGKGGGSGGFGGGGGEVGDNGDGFPGGSGGFGGGGGGAFEFSGTQGVGGFGGGNGGFSPRPGDGGGAGMGGAIFNHNGWLLVTNSTLVQNKAQGGTGGAGNSEGTGNAQAAGDGGSGFGGSIFNLNGVVTICSSTFASNVVVAGAGGLSNPGVTNGFAGGADGGALYTLALSQTASVTLINSILANSSGGKDLASRGSVLTATEPNIVRSFTNSGGGFTTTGVVAVDPLLGPLTNNGGFAYTMALLPGSPALDAGDSANAPVFDGRGLPRVSGAKVDLGAYELQVPTQLLFTNWKFVSGGGLQLQFSGSSGTGYTIVSTTDLTLPLSNWTVLGSAIETTNGEFQFNDTQAMSFPQRSYRVRQP